MSIGWHPDKSSVTREDASTDKPPAKPPRRSRLRGKIQMQPPGQIQGMMSMRNVQRQTDGTISSMGDEIALEHEVGSLTGQERHIINAYESGLINDSDLDVLLDY
ncbi:hypothetical protein OAL60_00590 [bacterium]|nr:hypothetical protein [bacterium]